MDEKIIQDRRYKEFFGDRVPEEIAGLAYGYFIQLISRFEDVCINDPPPSFKDLEKHCETLLTIEGELIKCRFFTNWSCEE